MTTGEGTGIQITEQTYEEIAMREPDEQWELHRGELRSKPTDMTFEHNQGARTLGFCLQSQLGMRDYIVSINLGRASRPVTTYYIPDIMVIPQALTAHFRERPRTLEAYRNPLPLVVEVWSPSTGYYDVDEKLPEYQRRGDLEIWRIHPYERTLIAWRRQPDGSYSESLYRGGTIQPVVLPGAKVDLDALFDA
ncbi:MAG: Uma2 family endonuclease [Dehalococcoidia bacterium]